MRLKVFISGFVLFVVGLLCLDPPRIARSWWQSVAQNAIIGGDSNFGAVILLFSGIDTNGSTTIPDLSSQADGNATITGSPTISTTTPVNSFSSSVSTAGTTGGSSDYFTWGNGSSGPIQNLDTPSDTAAVYTIEIAWKPSAAGSVFGWGGTWIGVGTFGGFVANNSDGSFRVFNGYATGVGGFDFSSSASQWSSGTSYWLILESNGTKVRLYLGDMSGTTASMIASTTTFTGGKNALSGGTAWFSYYGFNGQSAGKFNWSRWTKGVARYNSDSPVNIPSFPLPTF